MKTLKICIKRKGGRTDDKEIIALLLLAMMLSHFNSMVEGATRRQWWWRRHLQDWHHRYSFTGWRGVPGCTKNERKYRRQNCHRYLSWQLPRQNHHCQGVGVSFWSWCEGHYFVQLYQGSCCHWQFVKPVQTCFSLLVLPWRSGNHCQQSWHCFTCDDLQTNPAKAAEMGAKTFIHALCTSPSSRHFLPVVS